MALNATNDALNLGANLGATVAALVCRKGYAPPPIDLETGKNRYPTNILRIVNVKPKKSVNREFQRVF